jgi:hypothetical protein
MPLEHALCSYRFAAKQNPTNHKTCERAKLSQTGSGRKALKQLAKLPGSSSSPDPSLKAIALEASFIKVRMNRYLYNAN